MTGTVVPLHPPSGLETPALQPMLATRVTEPFDSPDYLFEVKWDGVRALLHVDPEGTRLISRRNQDLVPLFPELAALGRQVSARTAVVDGEVVIPDRQGHPRMDRLRRRLSARPDDVAALSARWPATFHAFDLLRWNGRLLTDQPLEARRAELHLQVSAGGSLVLPDPFEEDGEALFAEITRRRLEGVVAKRRGSLYLPGERSRDWLKIKRARDGEFVIGGYTIGGGRRRDYLNGILVGYLNDGGLHYCARVEGGFDVQERELVTGMERLHDRRCPFVTEPRTDRITFYVKPELVAQIAFAGWRPNGTLAFPVFTTLRPDVPIEDCRLEEEVEPPG